jgi:hypothetical protein
MGYVEKIMGDSEEVLYRTHQHIIVPLEQALGSLLAFTVLLVLGLVVLLSPAGEPGVQTRWWVGLAVLICLAIPLFLIVSAWLGGKRGRELVKAIWRFVAVGLLMLVVSLVLMLHLGAKPVGWLGVLLAVVPLVEVTRIFFDWLNERYIITNWRVMEVRGIVNKHVRDSALEKVNDVDLNQSIVGRMLHYGTVQIITGSDIGVNKFRRIWNPVRFKRAMLNAKEDLQREASGDEVEVRSPAGAPDAVVDIPDLLVELDELRQKGILSDDEFRDKKRELLDRL